MALREYIASITSHPTVYEFQRWILGGRKLDQNLEPIVQRVCQGSEGGVVVDVGGGTARSRALWPLNWTYFSIDPDDRMATLDEGNFSIERVVGSADHLPFENDFADVVFMKDTSHHLDDATWIASLGEMARILKPNGHFVFLDATFNPSRWFSVGFWKLDNGKWPRTSAVLEADLRDFFTIEEIDRFSLIHNVILVTAKQK